MKYAHINENGQILGWYDKEIHTSIPTPNVEVSDDVWHNAIDNNHNKVNEDGTTEVCDFRTAAEKEKQELEAKITEAKAYLASTDYVTAKYNDEVTVTGSMTKAAFLAKYSDVYAQRAEARAIINMGDA